ncbi:MAG TPA: nucleotidyltransferase domain-containing protein [Candidatus Tripitaka californicus]|uniref:nucleotidyltransferase domain-containing protein n=1 Tax=Candidatus Tripitaka californicus TaxID=3367616 RepID=UPI0040252877
MAFTESSTPFNGLSGPTCRHVIELLLRQVRGRPADWQDVIDTAWGEGLSCLLYKYLKDTNGQMPLKDGCRGGFEPRPYKYLEELRRGYLSTLIQNKYYFRELVRCLKAIDVPVILLKGAALLPVVYNDLGARSLVDFDILIQHKDLPEVTRCLVEQGYEQCGVSGPCVNRVCFKKRGEYVLPIEVHWHIDNATLPNLEKVSLERMWQTALPVEIEGHPSLIFAPHHQLLHLSVHALRHTYDRLILLYDMHLVIEHYRESLDWERLVKEAREFGLSRPVYYGLYLTRLFLNTNIPEHVMNQLRPLSLGLEERAFVYLVNRGIRRPGLQGLVHFAMCRGELKKMRFLWRIFFPPRDILAEVAAVDGTEVGVAHYFKAISWRLQCMWRLMGANGGG